MPKDTEIFFGQGGQLRSGFGKQILGQAATSPDCGFGSSTRDASLRLYASADHDKAKVKSSGGNQSQGAIYKVSTGFGKQMLSNQESGPSYGVGSEQRKGLATKNSMPGPGKYKVESLKMNQSKAVFGSGTRSQREKVYQDAESEKTYYGRLSPGPCAYDARSGMGAQVLSDKKSSLTTGLGHGGRFNYDFVRRAKEQPGAGDYNQGPACGRQQVSTKKSLPLYSFGASTRDQAGRVYLTREHEKGQASGSGKQVLSRKKTQPAASFGSAQRFGKGYYSSAISPGPAAYAA